MFLFVVSNKIFVTAIWRVEMYSSFNKLYPQNF